MDIIAYAKAHNVSAAAEKFGVAWKCVRRWKSHEGKIRSVPEAAVTKKMRLRDGRREIALPELEEDLYKGILEELLLLEPPPPQIEAHSDPILETSEARAFI